MHHHMRRTERSAESKDNLVIFRRKNCLNKMISNTFVYASFPRSRATQHSSCSSVGIKSLCHFGNPSKMDQFLEFRILTRCLFMFFSELEILEHNKKIFFTRSNCKIENLSNHAKFQPINNQIFRLRYLTQPIRNQPTVTF